MLSKSLIYDPVEIVHAVRGEGLVVRHGHGCGIARVDLRSDRVIHCPLPTESPEIRYGAFRRIVASIRSSARWIRTDMGAYLWDGTCPLGRIQADGSEVLATGGDCYLGLSSDGWDQVRGRFSSPSQN